MLRVWRLLEPTTWVAQSQQKKSELRRTSKWRDPPEEIEEEDDLLTGEELKWFQSVAARFNCLAMDRPDLLYSVKELMRKMASPHTKDLIALKRVARYAIKYSRMACRYVRTHWTVTLKSVATRTLLDVFLRESQFVNAWSKTMGVLA